MANVRTGNKAPNFELKDLDGKRVSLQEGLKRGPVVAARQENRNGTVVHCLRTGTTTRWL